MNYDFPEGEELPSWQHSSESESPIRVATGWALVYVRISMFLRRVFKISLRPICVFRGNIMGSDSGMSFVGNPKCVVDRWCGRCDKMFQIPFEENFTNELP